MMRSDTMAGGKRQKKMNHLVSFLRRGAAMAAQEVRATELELQQALHRTGLQTKPFSTFLDKRDAGGCATILPGQIAHTGSVRYTLEVLVRGRVTSRHLAKLVLWVRSTRLAGSPNSPCRFAILSL